MTGGGQFIQTAGDGTGAGGKREEEIEGERERESFICLLLSRVDNTLITCMILSCYYLYASSPFHVLPFLGPLYVMIPPTTNSADLLQAMQQGQTQRPLMPRLSTGALA